MSFKNPDPCTCGASLPWHLFEFGLTDHTCSCGRQYKLDADGGAILQEEKDEKWSNFVKSHT